jgi:hypothetical protein
VLYKINTPDAREEIQTRSTVWEINERSSIPGMSKAPRAAGKLCQSFSMARKSRPSLFLGRWWHKNDSARTLRQGVKTEEYFSEPFCRGANGGGAC